MMGRRVWPASHLPPPARWRRILILVALIAAPALMFTPASAAPKNDRFAGAATVTLPAVVRGSTTGATLERRERSDCVARSSLWYTFTSELRMPVIIDVETSRSYGAAALYKGSSLTNLQRVACVRWDRPRDGLLIESGVRYYVQVGNASRDQAPGPFTLHIGVGWAASASGSKIHAYTDGDGATGVGIAGVLITGAVVKHRGREGYGALCVAPLIYMCIGTRGSYSVSDEGDVKPCIEDVCRTITPPTVFGSPLPGEASVPSWVKLDAFRAGPWTVNAYAGRTVGAPQICVVAERTVIRRDRKTLLGEAGCGNPSGYWFDPASWRANVAVAMHTWSFREDYRRSYGQWDWISGWSKPSRAQVNLRWFGRGEPTTGTSISPPVIGVCYWPPGCVVPPLVTLTSSKAARVEGSIRFASLRLTATAPRGARGSMAWWV